MLVGYARVSTQDQNLDMQRKALTEAGCGKLFEEKATGSQADRPGLMQALDPQPLIQIVLQCLMNMRWHR